MKSTVRPAGFILHESLMAIAMAMALVVGIAQLITLVTQQRRLARQSSVAMREAGNLMEDLVSRNWTETTAEKLASVELSDSARRCLPDAAVKVSVVSEDDDVRRIGIEIGWARTSEHRGRPVCLVGWKFRPEEDG
jgi:type II secretory pathway pseudopilin PulG